MSETELKQRQVPKISNMNAASGPPSRTKAKTRTITWRDVEEWQLDNKYILGGYRPAKADYVEIFTSLTFLHNETCNVYTHLLGALLLPVVANIFLRYLARPEFLNVTSMDYAMFGIYFWCAEICLVLSALYHLMQPHSHKVEQFWHGMDLLGIVIVTMGTFSSGIYYVFFCEPSLQKLHWGIVSLRPVLSLLYQLSPSTARRLVSKITKIC
jgi:adiponectin receptor